MPTSIDLTPGQLREAVKLSEQIDALRLRLQAILGGEPRGGSSKATPVRTPRKRRMSPEGRARIAAAAKARWARLRGGKPTTAERTLPAKAVSKKKGGLTPEGRERLAAAMKARWAARKKGAPAPNARPAA